MTTSFIFLSSDKLLELFAHLHVFSYHNGADDFFQHKKFLSFYSHKITLFFIIVKTVLQTDFFCNKFRRANNLFGPPSYHLRYFSKDKRKTLWEYNDCNGEGRAQGRRKTKCRGGVERENEIATCEIFHKP